MSEDEAHAPLYYAVVQADFNPVAAMEKKYLQDVQEELRIKGYTGFKHHQNTQIQLTNPGQKRAKPKIQRATSWHFTRSDRSAGFVLETSRISFHTTAYQNHVWFINELLLGLGVVSRVAKLAHLTRLGMRYLNAILPQAEEKVEPYLIGGVLGLSLEGVPRPYAVTESLFNSDTGPNRQGTLLVRVYQLTGLLGYPPDLMPTTDLQLNPRFILKEPQPHAILDTDHFVDGMTMPLDRLDDCRELLNTMHEGIERVFRDTSTAHALQAWHLT